ncbi:hypothetical protein [Streptomyces sp. NPDC005969]|uniref:hypothetical protein n=1 Tax=Streptomyces sp. NPDC005969 TaxID=3156722 RepID=UPI0033F1788A
MAVPHREPGPRGEQAELLAALRCAHHRMLCAADRSDPVWEASLCLSESLMNLVAIAIDRGRDGDPAHRAAAADQARAAVRAAAVATRFALTDRAPGRGCHSGTSARSPERGDVWNGPWPSAAPTTLRREAVDSRGDSTWLT